eukprot:3958038-Prymnesium_polylepis.1
MARRASARGAGGGRPWVALSCDRDAVGRLEHLQIGAAAQQVVQPVVIHLDVRAAHLAHLRLRVERLEELQARTWHDAPLRRVAAQEVDQHRLRAEHRVRLARARLAVGEDRGVPPGEHVVDARPARALTASSENSKLRTASVLPKPPACGLTLISPCASPSSTGLRRAYTATDCDAASFALIATAARDGFSAAAGFSSSRGVADATGFGGCEDGSPCSGLCCGCLLCFSAPDKRRIVSSELSSTAQRERAERAPQPVCGTFVITALDTAIKFRRHPINCNSLSWTR